MAASSGRSAWRTSSDAYWRPTARAPRPGRTMPRSTRACAWITAPGGIDLGFELAELGPEREWALLFDVGVVTAGIDVNGGHTDVLLFGAKPWFAKKTASLRAVERRYE
jgi:hypothetical protein